ncbi:Mitogenactivated protein kinase kinase kinase 13Alike, partial [Caligus rogercresseyi]
MHLDIAAVEILSFLPEDYFRTQQSWKIEVWEYNERMKAEDTKMIPLAENDLLLRRRKEELQHAQDVKELYERKLQKVNDLYLELSAWKLQLEEKEKMLN